LGLSAVIKDQATGEVSLKWSPINDVNIYDDFEEVANNFTYSDTCFTIENGYLKASGMADNEWKTATLKNDFQDFLLEYKFQQVEGSNNYSMGSFIRANGSLDEDNSEGYLINVTPDGSYGVWKFTGKMATNLVPWNTTTAINPTPGAWNIVTIEAIGNLIKIYVNGQYVDEFSDNTFASGKINIDCSFGQPYKYDIRWDYVNVITSGTSLTAFNLPKATNTLIAGADKNNFISHPLVSTSPNNIVEPKGIISQIKSNQNFDIFSYYKIYRDSVLLKTTNNTAYTDTLPEHGTYQYFVTSMFGEDESNSTNQATVTWGDFNSMTGDNCSNAQDLAGLTSPYLASTIGYKHDFDYCDMGLAPDRIFYITLPSNHSLKIGPQYAFYDMQYSLRVGGDCPGNKEIACVDEPDNKLYTYINNSDSAQKVYFIASGYDGDSGELFLQWDISSIAMPVADFTVNTTTISPGGSIYFTDATKEITTSWRWLFPGGNP